MVFPLLFKLLRTYGNHFRSVTSSRFTIILYLSYRGVTSTFVLRRGLIICTVPPLSFLQILTLPIIKVSEKKTIGGYGN